MTATLTEERMVLDHDTEPDIPTSPNKPESVHIVHRPDDEQGGGPGETNHAYVLRARIEGFAITALCGWVFTPSGSAANLPVCAECKDIWDSMPDDGEGWVHE